MERVEPLAGRVTRDNTSVVREGDAHGGCSLDSSLSSDNRGERASNGQDHGLRGVEDSRELRDAEHAEIGDAEGSSLELVRLKRLAASALNKVLGSAADGSEALLISSGDDGGNETTFNGDGQRDVYVVHKLNLLGFGVKLSVGLGNLAESKSRGADEEVGNRKFLAISASGVESLAEARQGSKINFASGILVRNGGLGFGQALSNDTAHVVQLNVGVSRRSGTLAIDS